MDTTPSTSDPDTSPAPGGQLDIPVCQRAEFLAATLMLAKQEGTEEALHAASRGLEVLFDEGMDPSTRGLLVVSVPPDLAETFIAAYSLIPRELRAKWKRETANGYERMADEAEANGDHLLADAARANIAPQRRAACALAGKPAPHRPCITPEGEARSH